MIAAFLRPGRFGGSWPAHLMTFVRKSDALGMKTVMKIPDRPSIISEKYEKQ
jgi:hypothetical protein